jgi:hypothetical protein
MFEAFKKLSLNIPQNSLLGGVGGGLVHLLDIRRRPLTTFGVTKIASFRGL